MNEIHKMKVALIGAGPARLAFSDKQIEISQISPKKMENLKKK